MAERPILFSGPMVRAILTGTKTQTRRVVACPKGICGKCFTEGVPHNTNEKVDRDCPYLRIAYCEENEVVGTRLPAPWSRGDSLWVKETFYCDHVFAGDLAMSRSGYVGEAPSEEAIVAEWRDNLYYRADVRTGRFEDAGYWGEPGGRWTSPLFMPRWASRITLAVKSVRVERLQDITHDDAIAEGIERNNDDGVTYYGPLNAGHADPRFEFQRLWNSINADRGFGWDANPWVWVVGFERVEANHG